MRRGSGRRPILLRELDTPKMRAGRKEFDADSRAFIGSVAEIYDTAFLLILRLRVDQDEIGAKLERFLKIKQTAVRVYDDRVTALAELAAVEVFALGLHGDARKNPGTAALRADLSFPHGHNLSCSAAGGESTARTSGVPKEAVRNNLLKWPLHA